MNNNMKTYLVDGTGRDTLLSYPFKEKDWIVVGATADNMITACYQQARKLSYIFAFGIKRRACPGAN
jgi:hypothetical protein